MTRHAPHPLPVIEALDIPLDRDRFIRNLIRELAGTLEDVIGLKDAEGFIAAVGQTIGEAAGGTSR